MSERITVTITTEVELFTEREAKKELSNYSLDYTFLDKLFVKVDITDSLRYIKVENFDFCIGIIESERNLKQSLPRDSW